MGSCNFKKIFDLLNGQPYYIFFLHVYFQNLLCSFSQVYSWIWAVLNFSVCQMQANIKQEDLAITILPLLKILHYWQWFLLAWGFLPSFCLQQPSNSKSYSTLRPIVIRPRLVQTKGFTTLKKIFWCSGHWIKNMIWTWIWRSLPSQMSWLCVFVLSFQCLLGSSLYWRSGAVCSWCYFIAQHHKVLTET